MNRTLGAPPNALNYLDAQYWTVWIGLVAQPIYPMVYRSPICGKRKGKLRKSCTVLNLNPGIFQMRITAVLGIK